jgi:hypothetical protein
VVCPTHVNCRAGTVKISRAKDAERLRPKGYRGRLLRRCTRSTRTRKTAGVLAGTTPLVSSTRNTVNPMSRSREGAGVSVRDADGAAGRGCWRKPRPLCNGADRRGAELGAITPLRKQAHFQLVVRDERDGRTLFVAVQPARIKYTMHQVR